MPPKPRTKAAVKATPTVLKQSKPKKEKKEKPAKSERDISPEMETRENTARIQDISIKLSRQLVGSFRV